jgi:hypothetical protein
VPLTSLLAVPVVALGFAAARRFGATSPLSLFLLTWTAAIAGYTLIADKVLPLGFGTLTAVTVGLGATMIGGQFARLRHGRVSRRTATILPQRRRVRRALLALDGLLLLGILGFLVRVQGTLGVESLVTDRRLLRYEQSYGDLRRLGVISLLLALAQPAAGLAGVALRVHRARWAAVATVALVIVAASTQSSRTYQLGCGVWLVLGATYAAPSLPKFSRRSLGAGAAIVAAALIVFTVTGTSLGKSTTDESAIPIELHYLSSSLPALAVIIDEDTAPEAARGRTLGVILNAVAVLNPTVVPPETITEFVQVGAPGLDIPTNVYSWVGDVYIDSGYFGILATGLLLGYGFVRAYQRLCRRPSLTMLYTCCVLASVGMGSILLFTLLSISNIVALTTSLLLAAYLSQGVKVRRAGTPAPEPAMNERPAAIEPALGPPLSA